MTFIARGGPGLFERVTGYFADGVSIDDFSPQEQTFLSVRDNIQRILNSRRGALAHLPGYGLEDMSNIYRHLPASAHRLSRAIEATLLEYEPRLKTVEIEIQAPDLDTLLRFTLVCHLHREGLVRFGTEFLLDGRARLILLQNALNR